MTFTYNLGGSGTTLLIAKVRLLIPDTDVTTAELSDEEISYFLTERGNNVTAAAIDACRMLARKFAQQPDFTADGVSIHSASRASAYAARVAELAAGSGGGISSAPMTRDDGFNDEAERSKYQRRPIYTWV